MRLGISPGAVTFTTMRFKVAQVAAQLVLLAALAGAFAPQDTWRPRGWVAGSEAGRVELFQPGPTPVFSSSPHHGSVPTRHEYNRHRPHCLTRPLSTRRRGESDFMEKITTCDSSWSLRRDVVREALGMLASVVAGSAVLGGPGQATRARAAGDDEEDGGRGSTAAAAFAVVEKGLASDGAIKRLAALVENEDWDTILGATKEIDLSFRKVTLKEAAAALDGEAKSEAMDLRSDVSLMLMAVNKAARPKIRSKASASAALNRLTEDLNKFMELKP